ncbi:hypothetical protein SLS62_006531 [Diatrype stigma]|uniref:FAD-binding PCMH-type domain-containing protein n=1 Tax=Diatrype stigma TaxID=117547 RepID=A0AAN9YNY5_9PEZI
MAESAAAICDVLTAQLPGAVTTQNSSDYKAAQEQPWSPTCWLPAACYVRPKNTAEVALVVKSITQAGSKFAVRGGGHNANPGVNGVSSPGVVIDLRNLTSMSVGEDGVLHVGSGAKWGEIYTYLEKKNLTAIGGRNNDVGIGGYMLGGGMPAFPNLHGLAVDSLKSAEVVLADSSVVTASSKENPDLLRALKGGGTNFGIVTRYDIQTYPLIQTQYTVNIYNTADYDNIHNATANLQKAMEEDPKIGAFVNVQATFVAVGLLYAEWTAERPKAFDEFFNLGSLLQAAVPTTNGTIKSLVDSLDLLGENYRRAHATTSSTVSKQLYVQVHELRNELRGAHPKMANLSYTIQPLSTTAIQIGQDRGTNTMGIQNVPQSVWAFLVEWNDAADDAEAEQVLNELTEGMKSLASADGLLLDFIFMNDASAKQQVLASYGPDNVKQLRDTAAKYDPQGVFQELQNDGFLLRNIA